MNQLDALLSNTYTADIKGKKAAAISDFKTAVQGDAFLAASAQARLKELDDLITTRGVQACAFSTKYWQYLKEVLDA